MNGRRRSNGKLFRANARSVRFLPACERLEDIQLLSSISVPIDDYYTLYGNQDGSDLTTYDYELGAGGPNADGDVYVGLFEFPTSSIPSDVIDSPSSITSATLAFSDVELFGSAPANFSASPVNVIGLSGFNGSTTIQSGDYFNSPGQTVGSFDPILAYYDSPAGVYTVDATSFVKQALANNSTPQEIAFRLEAPGGNVDMDIDGYGGGPVLTITYGDYTAITPTLSLLPDGSGGVSVDYTVTGTLPQGSDPEVDLYWSPTSTYDASTATATDASVPVEQTHDGPTSFTAADLGTPPAGTDYLLAVADPGHAVTDPETPPVVASTPYDPTISITGMAYVDNGQDVQVSYSETGDTQGASANLTFYASDQDDLAAGDPNQVATAVSIPVVISSYGQATVPLDSLQSAFNSTTEFIVAAFNNVSLFDVANADDSVPLSSYPVITPTLAWLPDGRGGVNVDYTITGDLPQGTTPEIDLYWSPTKTFDPNTASFTGANVTVAQNA